MFPKTDSLTTWGGIISGIGVGLVGLPLGTLAYYAQVVKDGPPAWFNAIQFPMILVGAFLAMVGNVIIGVAAKDKTTHSTIDQIQAASAAKQADVMVKTADAAPTPVKEVEVVNPPNIVSPTQQK